mmetsp:Transcript_20478/g.72413  ORF Transcript_20478/g.72413 Transcript_20478/m.72413 type:complete len:546 (-) Transcript_20478:39-1676(-)|eukprot:CAMPEP_0203816696 /NCGR_PEP_ID=MMETSP0115-20131106/17679_1 /ASSEMBLY_ACC=CAM_ASM_000227 /TAXON_ID=33651 /ORGANISM="Bicosoecid sp, Strain ms1" /LENGTH=545 /DNA_ID=CAMNT_0050725605 /DNA_START=166 /DNA_END=1803 /DNA_ORIENTATION=+
MAAEAAAAGGAGAEAVDEAVEGFEMIAIIDFGSQYSHLIARRVRELKCYCELYSCTDDPAKYAGRRLVGVILSGGPFSVYQDGAPHAHADLWKLVQERDLPVLGICYGLQEMVHAHGGRVEPGEKREFGYAKVDRTPAEGALAAAGAALFAGIEDGFQVWMSHSDKVISLPDGFVTTAKSDSTESAAVVGMGGRWLGVQFHPEVNHTPCGRTLLSNFVLGMCKCPQTWNIASFLDREVEAIRKVVGPEGKVLGAVSGGVDSTVAAVLLNRAIGDRFHAVMVDNGLLRHDEAALCLKRLRDECGVNLRVVDASDRFLAALAGVEDPEKKRKIIGANFIEVFEEEAAEIGKVDFLLQGTLYPDVIESVSFKGPSATIKSHHNVGGLIDNMRLKLIEPLRELFKDEVRELGVAMGLPEASVFRHPFPGPGLGIRILGAVTKEACDLLRQADKIYLDELHAAGEYRNIAQAFAVLLPCKSVGVMGDGRTYEQVLALRAVATTDYMTADWYHMPYGVLATISTRIINEVAGINRVCYDISSKPPATIEWE